MLRIRCALITLPLALFLFGCGQPGSTGEDTSNVETSMEVTPETKTPPTPKITGVYGTWTNERAGVGRFNTLVLMTDGRFHSSRQVICIKAPCLPIEENGTFEVYRRDGGRYIALLAQGAQDAQRYEFVSKTGLLQLRHILPGSTWYSMQHAAVAWCAEAKDCAMQALPPGPYRGGYTCNQNQCAWQCGNEDEQAMK